MSYYPQPAPKRSRWKTWQRIVFGTSLALIAMVCIGVSVSQMLTPNRSAEDIPTTTGNAPVMVHPSSAAKAPTTTAKSKPVASIHGDDVVHVGEDIPAGTYRAVADVDEGGYCYWQKSSDAEGQKIISNGAPQGGRPQVVLKSGQWFSSTGCPGWAKR